MAGSRARTIMIMRAEVERDSTGSTDPYGHPETANFETLATIPCRVYSKTRREINDDRKFVLIEEIRCMMPVGTDVTELDRINRVTDRLGVEIFAGPLRIDTIRRKQTFITMVLKGVKGQS